MASSAAPESGRLDRYKIAVLVPCYNEEVAVAKVVKDFRAALPSAAIFVFDNNSTDNTAAAARAAGAEVFAEKHQGKGFVVRRMFTDVEADIYVLVDGDATYDAPSAPAMIERLLEERLDMVVGNRVDRDLAAYRAGHRAGNWLLTAFVAERVRAELQGHVVGLPGVLAPLREVVSGAVGRLRDRDRAHHPRARTGAAGGGRSTRPITRGRKARPPSSTPGATACASCAPSSRFYRAERPLPFFTGIGLALAIASVGFAIPIFVTYFETGLVPRLPTAVLSTGLMVLAFLSGAIGLVLDTVTRGRREMKLLAYLSHRAPGEERRRG